MTPQEAIENIINCYRNRIPMDIKTARLAIKALEFYQDLEERIPLLDYCPRCGSQSIYQCDEHGAMECEECQLVCYVVEKRR